jgi:glycerol uptake facilitator-like aquaporin
MGPLQSDRCRPLIILQVVGAIAAAAVHYAIKAGVTWACFHEPMVNRTYADLARHYGTAISPARPSHPKD